MSESNKRNFIVHGSILAIAGILDNRHALQNSCS